MSNTEHIIQKNKFTMKISIIWAKACSFMSQLQESQCIQLCSSNVLLLLEKIEAGL